MRKIKFISILLVLSMLLTVPAFAFFHRLYGRVGESNLRGSRFISCRRWHSERDGIRQIRTEREDHGQPVGDDALPRV